MTKNHILIKSVVLGVVLTLSPFAKAGVDRVLVTYFDILYKNQSPKCSLSEATKSQIISEIEAEKCLIRSTSEGQSYISGVQAPCTDASVKAKVDARVNGLCVNTAQQAEKDALAKYAANQQAAAKKQQQGGSSGGGGGLDAQTVNDVGNLLMTYQQMKKDKKAEKAKNGQSDNSGSSNNNSGSSNNSTAPTASKTSGESSGGGSGGGSSGISHEAGTNAAATEKAKNPTTYTQYPMQDGSAGSVVQRTDPDGNTTLTKYDSKGNVVDTREISKQDGGQVDDQVGKLGGNAGEGKTTQDPEFANAAEKVHPSIKDKAKEATDGSQKSGKDAALDARNEKAKAEDTNLEAQITKIKAQLDSARKMLPNEATEKCNANEATRDPYTQKTKNIKLEQECNMSAPQKAITCLDTNYTALKAAADKLKEEKQSCSSSSAQAEKMCSMVRSEKAQQVQQVMSLGATVLSKMTAAGDACGTTSTISKVAQGGMLAAQAACSAMKFRCDFSCASAEKSMKIIKEKAEIIRSSCQLQLDAIAINGEQASQAAGLLVQELDKQLMEPKAPKDPNAGAVPASIAQCKEHKLDMATMGLAALGFLSAAQDAQKCKEQLNAGGNGGNGTTTSGLAGPTMTTAEYCAQPQNATTVTCKCTANPNGEGCLGSLAGSGVALGKINTNGGASGFASAKQNGLGTLDPSAKKSTGDSSSEPPPGAGLSEAAREALGMNGGAGGSPGVSGNFGSGSENSKAASKEEKEKPKYGFFSSLGSMLSGGKSANQAAKAAIRNYEQDQAIKRKVASEQLRAEITTASGKSNFDKISNRYRESASSFEK